jgi:hypothetical protein
MRNNIARVPIPDFNSNDLKGFVQQKFRWAEFGISRHRILSVKKAPCKFSCLTQLKKKFSVNKSQQTVNTYYETFILKKAGSKKSHGTLPFRGTSGQIRIA